MCTAPSKWSLFTLVILSLFSHSMRWKTNAIFSPKKKTNFEYKAFLDILTYVQVNKSIYQKNGKSA